MQNTLNRILEYSSTNNYLANFVFSATLIEAVKSGFVTDPSETYITTTQTFLQNALSSLSLNADGVNADGTNYGRRWSMYFLTALFSEYPISEVFT